MNSRSKIAETVEEKVVDFSSRIQASLRWKYFAEGLTTWSFLWGTIILVFRAGFGQGEFPATLGLAGIPLFFFWALHRAAKRCPSTESIKSFLDRWSHCGGLLVSSSEVELSGWWEKVPPVSSPELRWGRRRNLGFFAGSLFFALCASIIPVGDVLGNQVHTLDVKEETQKLKKQLQALADENMVSPEKVENLARELDNLKNNTAAEDPAKILEALDHAEEMAQKAAKEAAEQSQKSIEKLKEIDQLTQNLQWLRKTKGQENQQDGSGTMDPGDPSRYNGMGGPEDQKKTEEMKKLGEMMKAAFQSGAMLPEDFASSTLKALQENALTPGQLKELQAATLKKVRVFKGKIEKIKKSDILKSDDLLLSDEESDEKDPKDPSLFMLGNGKSDKKPDTLILFPGSGGDNGDSGAGGISRGRGDAPLNFSGKTNPDGVKFQDRDLPKGDSSQIDNAQSMGVAISAPTVEKSGQNDSGGVLNNAQGGESSAFSNRILPRHRSTIKRYFNRK